MDKPCQICGDPVSVLDLDPTRFLSDGDAVTEWRAGDDDNVDHDDPSDDFDEEWDGLEFELGVPMTPHTQPEYAVFHALRAAVTTTEADWLKWQSRVARATSMSNADWKRWMRAKDEHAAALAVLDEFYDRMEVSHA